MRIAYPYVYDLGMGRIRINLKIYIKIFYLSELNYFSHFVLRHPVLHMYKKH